MAAKRWEHDVERVVEEKCLTFLQWLVLEATADSVTETKDAVSQALLAARLALHKMVVSRAMTALEQQGLVSRGPDMTGTAWRIYVTAKGAALLDACSASVGAASSRGIATLR